MKRYHAVIKNDCQCIVLYFLEFSSPRPNRTFEHPQLIIFLTDLKKKDSHSCSRSHASKSNELNFLSFFEVWVYSTQSNFKSWVPDDNNDKHTLCKKQSNEM